METIGSDGINRKKLFAGICLALVPTAFSFVLVSNILHQLKTEFVLTNADVGYIGGAALWGMAISLLVLGPFLEKIGLKAATVGAFIGHLAGVTLFLLAYPFAGAPIGFWILFLGAIGMGVGNGLIEAAGNPLTAALYPENKTTKLNHFHAFFPGGMVVGGLLGWFMVQIGTVGALNIGHWTFQMAFVYVPIIVYGILVLPEKFPRTETAEAGIPIRDVFRFTLTHPLVWLLIILKMITVSLELGPMRWIPEVLQAAGVHGMLVFVWISGLMMVLRVFAGPVVHTFSPTGMLLGASVLTGLGIFMFSIFETGLMPLMLAATVFAVGVAFFFPTMVGYMSERYPQAGSLAIVLMIGMAMIAAGTAQGVMGSIADRYLPDALDVQQTVALLEQVEERYPGYEAQAEAVAGDPDALAALGYRAADVQNVIHHTEQALEHFRADGALHGSHTGNALRAILDVPVQGEEPLLAEAHAILRPADNYGGRMAFRWVAPIALIVALFFLIMYVQDRRRGGYQAVRLKGKMAEAIESTTPSST